MAVTPAPSTTAPTPLRPARSRPILNWLAAPRSLALRSPAALAALAALLSLGVLLFGRHEQATLAVPWEQCQPVVGTPLRWSWPLPESLHWLAAAQTPRRDSSFLFWGERLIPLEFPYDDLPAADRQRSGWHRIEQMRLEFQLPAELAGVAAQSGQELVTTPANQIGDRLLVTHNPKHERGTCTGAGLVLAHASGCEDCSAGPHLRIGSDLLTSQPVASQPATLQPHSLQLELNGTMSLRRQFASVVLVLSFAVLAWWQRRAQDKIQQEQDESQPAQGQTKPSTAATLRFGPGPLLAIAALAPLALIASLIVATIEPLPLDWRFTVLGIAWDRLDAIAPGLLVLYAICGWYHDRGGLGGLRKTSNLKVPEQVERSDDLQTFIRFGWLAGISLFLGSFTRMLCWGVGTTHAWSPVEISSSFCAAIAFSDAEGYLAGVYRLISEGTLDPWNQRRPINAALFSGRMLAAGWNLDVARWIQAVLVAGSAAWAARELARVYGWRVGVAALAFLWGCGRLFLTTTLSEPLGFALGTLSLVGWLRWLHRGSFTSGLMGLALMTLAQSSRPGALLVLPPLVLCLALCGRPPLGRYRQRALRLGAAIVVVGVMLAVNPLLSRLYGTGENMTGSNFAHTFAGLATGRSWSEVVQEHQSHLDSLPNEKAVATFLYQEGFRQFRRQPEVLVGQLVRGLVQFGIELPRFLTGITWRANIDGLFPLLWFHLLVILGLAALNLCRQWRCRCRREWGFWLAMFGGVMASVPIVFLDGGLRVLMATWPAVLAWLAAGLAPAPAAMPINTDEAAGPRTAWPLLSAVAGVIALALASPLVAHEWFARTSAAIASDPGAAAVAVMSHSDPHPEKKTVQSNPTAGSQDAGGDAGYRLANLQVDRRLCGPAVWVGRGAATERREGHRPNREASREAGREMTLAQWQRQWQLSGIDPQRCLLAAMPQPPFRLVQVFDRQTGTTKILMLPPAEADVCAGSAGDGSRLGATRSAL